MTKKGATRLASQGKISLSIALMSLAGGLTAVLLAWVVFAFGTFTPDVAFAATHFAAFLALLASCYLGGRGMAQEHSALEARTQVPKKPSWFNLQAVAGVLAVGLATIGAVFDLGAPQTAELDKRLKALEVQGVQEGEALASIRSRLQVLEATPD